MFACTAVSSQESYEYSMNHSFLTTPKTFQRCKISNLFCLHSACRIKGNNV